MWILKNSKELLTNLQHQSLKNIYSIKTFDFSTLYTTIPHSKLKERLRSLVMRAFFTKKGKRRYKYMVVNYSEAYFVKYSSNSQRKYTEDEIIQMIEFLVDNIFVEFGGKIFQQTIGIPMGTNCAPLLADLFLFTYEAEFIEELIKSGQKDLAKSFSYTFRYIDDVLSLNNKKFIDNVHRIYPPELEIKDTTDSSTSASYLDLFLQRNQHGQLTTKLYDKRDDFNFPIVNFPYMDSNIPASPTYGIYMSQLIRYSRACSHYHDFRTRCRQLTHKLITQGFERCRLMKIMGKFFGQHSALIQKYSISLCNLKLDVFDNC